MIERFLQVYRFFFLSCENIMNPENGSWPPGHACLSIYLPHPQTQTRNNHVGVRIIRRTSARRRPREVALEPSPALINGAPDFKLRTSERTQTRLAANNSNRVALLRSLFWRGFLARKRRPEICRPGHTKKKHTAQLVAHTNMKLHASGSSPFFPLSLYLSLNGGAGWQRGGGARRV
jgi:hypothetical protein